MHARRSTTTGLALALFAVIAAACGDDDDDDSAATVATTAPDPAATTSAPPTTSEPEDSGATSATTAPAATTAPPTAAPTTAPPEPITIRMAQQGFNFGALPLIVALEEGFFEDDGVTLEITQTEQSSIGTAGMLSGEFDVQGGGVEVFAATEQGADLVAIAAAGNAPMWSLVAREGINTYADLVGKTVATSGPASSPTAVFTDVLEAAGVDPSTVELVTVGGTGARYAALEAGQVDAAILYTPAEIAAVQSGYTNVGLFADEIPQWAGGQVITTRTFLDENPDAAVRFLRGIVRGHQFLNDPANADRVVEIAAEVMELDPAVAREAYDLWYNAKGYPPNGEVDAVALQNALDTLLAIDVLTQPLTADAVLDTGPLDEAIASLA